MDLVIMIIISLISGFFASMNVWTVDKDHIRFHLNDVYMIGLMTVWMILLMAILYKDHYENYGTIIIISLISIMVFYYFIRNQIFIDDEQFLKGMIPHHSMGILMSQKIRDRTKDPRVRQLADYIIKTQEEEIRLMDEILKDPMDQK